MFKLDDKIYIAKWCEKLSIGEIAKGLSVNINTVNKEIQRQKQKGLFEKYKNLTDEEYETMLRRDNFRKRVRREK